MALRCIEYFSFSWHPLPFGEGFILSIEEATTEKICS